VRQYLSEPLPTNFPEVADFVTVISQCDALQHICEIQDAFRRCVLSCATVGAQVSTSIGLLNGGKSGTRQIQNTGEKTHCTPIRAPFNQNSCAGIS
jgi:hypothetical protein